MDSSENFEINYWGKEFSYSNQPKEGRTIKKRLAIVLLFIVLLAIAPTLIFNLKNSKQDEKISSTASVPTKEPSLSPTATPKQGVVLRNDSYWKISKRYCGTGIYYLAIQEKNNSKPLFEGDFVEIICN